MKSPVNWTVLGLVIEKPSYGYEIGQRFEHRFGEFLPVGISSIYAALDRLEKAALIEAMAVEGAGAAKRQPRLRYRATAEGVGAYRGWLADCIRVDPQRPGLLARMASIGMHGVEAMLDVLERYEQECLRERCSMAHTPASGTSARTPDTVSQLMDRLVAEEQRLSIDAQLRWVAYAREELRCYASNELLSTADVAAELLAKTETKELQAGAGSVAAPGATPILAPKRLSRRARRALAVSSPHHEPVLARGGVPLD
jgi:DNA-binding PadR family transcriptional regulator